MRLFRLLKIASVASRFGLDEMVLEHEPSGRLVRLANALQFWRNLSAPRAERRAWPWKRLARFSSSSGRCYLPAAT